MICKLRRYWIILRITLKGRRRVWDMAKFTGHDWQEIMRVGNVELEQCNSCKSLSTITHLGATEAADDFKEKKRRANEKLESKLAKEI